MQKAVDAMIDAVKKHGWDGEWYLRAYDFYGRKIGSNENDEAKIFIESQGWCTMAEIGAEDGMVAKSLDSCKKYLECEHGMVLNNPAFSKYIYEYGEISSYPEGYKENAGIFCHNNPWVIFAETVLGHGDRALELYRKTCPAYLEEIGEIHRTEPYVYCQMVAGKDAPTFGEGKNSWLTGTAAWTYTVVTEGILGIIPEYDGLRIDPCIPAEWKGYKAERIFRGSHYHITVRNPDGVQKGIKEIRVNGKAVNGSVIPPTEKELFVEVTMGQAVA